MREDRLARLPRKSREPQETRGQTLQQNRRGRLVANRIRKLYQEARRYHARLGIRAEWSARVCDPAANLDLGHIRAPHPAHTPPPPPPTQRPPPAPPHPPPQLPLHT